MFWINCNHIKWTNIHQFNNNENEDDKHKKSSKDSKGGKDDIIMAMVQIQFKLPINALYEPDVDRNITELIQARGYYVEDHSVITKDGYVLSLQRIPYKRFEKNLKPFGSKNNGKLAVILQHGVEDIGTTWVIHENVYQSLGFILADAGFDVWISNSRGTIYSNSHIKFKNSDTKYWDFTFDQMAEFDLPCVIDYVLNITGNEKVGYVGHSQGTTIGFISFSNPMIANKINVFIALAPVARVTNCESLFLKLLSALKIDQLLKLFGAKSFLANTEFARSWIAPPVCTILPSLCINSLSLIEGWESSENMNETRIPVFLAHSPGGTSLKNVVQWSQNYKYGFQKYDYGTKTENFIHYGQTIPPKYNLKAFSNSSLPIITFTGGTDFLADKIDVDWLLPQLSNLIYHKHLPTYSHLDFVLGVNAYKDIYNDTVSYLLKYSK